jgi:uncharacterized LabA/DUF88 family protein
MPKLEELLSNKPYLSRQGKKALFCIDYANWAYYLRNRNQRIRWNRFIEFWDRCFRQVEYYFYDGMECESHYFHYNPSKTKADFWNQQQKKLDFFGELKELGIRVRQKPINRIFDAIQRKPRFKCNFDVEIAITALDRIDHYDVFILGSGDGDFVNLIKYLKGHHKETLVISPKNFLSKQLKESAHNIHYLGRLLTFFARSKK